MNALRWLLAAALATAGALIAYVYWPAADSSVSSSQPAFEANTLAAVWQPQTFAEESRAETFGVERAPFTPEGVRQALKQVRVDEVGALVIDHDTLSALRAGFAELAGRLDEHHLARLQEIIRTGLPGAVGEQTAKLVADFHRYEAALPEFEAQYPTPADPAAALQHLDQLVALRQGHFGGDIAERLFGVEHAHARYTLESMRLESLNDIAPEEKAALQASLKERLPAGVLPDKPSAEQLEWERRYMQFAREKQRIESSLLPQDEQRRQIDLLYETHFREHERDRARSYVPRG